MPVNKQHVADRLAAVLGARVSIGLHRYWRQVVVGGVPQFQPDGRPVQEEVNEGEKYTRADTGEAVAPEDVNAAIAWLAANPPPPPPVLISYATLRARMTATEREAILTLRRTSWQIDDFITWAAGAGDRIDLNSQGVTDAKAALIAAGVFTAARAAEVFAP